MKVTTFRRNGGGCQRAWPPCGHYASSWQAGRKWVCLSLWRALHSAIGHLIFCMSSHQESWQRLGADYTDPCGHIWLHYKSRADGKTARHLSKQQFHQPQQETLQPQRVPPTQPALSTGLGDGSCGLWPEPQSFSPSSGFQEVRLPGLLKPFILCQPSSIQNEVAQHVQSPQAFVSGTLAGCHAGRQRSPEPKQAGRKAGSLHSNSTPIGARVEYPTTFTVPGVAIPGCCNARPEGSSAEPSDHFHNPGTQSPEAA